MQFRQNGRAGKRLDDVPALVAAARATASFPGAFPPFTLRELDRVLEKRGAGWPGRDAFIRAQLPRDADSDRSEEHTSELQSLMRISYAVFCLQKKKQITKNTDNQDVTNN